MNTPLIEAVKSGYYDLIDILLESGASVNHQDIYGNSVLTKAVVKGNEDAVIKLLANGADPALLDANGHNAMTWASASGFTHLEEIIRTRVEDEELFKKKYIDKSNVELETNSNPHEGETEQQDSIPPSQE